VFEVDEALLAALDEFEEAPEVYVRAEVELEGGERVLAYLLPAERAVGVAHLPDGIWPGP
jgi:gamma-glutamylcyclotransferase (GGCT)/AIG2-like uncharacterized protein YtfP